MHVVVLWLNNNDEYEGAWGVLIVKGNVGEVNPSCCIRSSIRNYVVDVPRSVKVVIIIILLLYIDCSSLFVNIMHQHYDYLPQSH